METTKDDSPADPPPSTGRRSLVIAGLAGFVLGGGVLGVLWAASGSASDAAADARAACAAYTRAGPLPTGAENSDTFLPSPLLLHRIAAARELSAAAAGLSPAYRDLADHLDGVSRMVLSLNFADAAGRRHVTKATELCGQV